MQETIERFYAAFDRRDGDTMAACYAPGARFSDPAFGELRGEEPGAMWRMLTGQATDLRVELGDHGADEAARTGHADVDNGARFTHAVKRARHEGIVLDCIREANKLGTRETAFVTCSLGCVLDDSADVGHDVHVDAGARRRCIYG